MEPMEMAVWSPEPYRVRSAKLTRFIIAVSALALVVVMFGVLRWSA
jgi:hypothetical protein